MPVDAQDHHRDDQTDERVAEFEPDGTYGCAGDHCEADEPIDAGVVAVGDQQRAVEPPAAVKLEPAYSNPTSAKDLLTSSM